LLAIKTDGTLWACGYNANAQLGVGTTVVQSSPTTVAGGGTNWKQVSMGGVHAAAIKTDGTLWTWGDDIYGELGNGTTVSRSSPGTTAAGGTNWKLVSCGYAHVAAIKTDGTLWLWGDGSWGQLGNNGSGSGNRISSPVTTSAGGTNWRQIACGYRHTAAIKTDGTLWTWGRDYYGELGQGIYSSSVLTPQTVLGGGTTWQQVSAGLQITAAVKTDGTLWTWGKDTYGALGTGTTVNASSPVTTIKGGNNWKSVTVGYNNIFGITEAAGW
jgi:alpha-tubulin suppressor-like RCC1 family protein